MQTVSGEPLTPTWLPMTSTISVFGLLHFSLHTTTGENNLSNESKLSRWKVSGMRHCCLYPEFTWKPDWKRKHRLLQTAVPLHVIPWCISRGKQCFWKPVWRPLCILLWLYMSTTVLLHWSLTLPPLQATSLSRSTGRPVLLLKALRQISFAAVKNAFNCCYSRNHFGTLSLHDRCLMDSILPGSSSKFTREQDNRLCFSVQTFHFNQESEEQVPTQNLLVVQWNSSWREQLFWVLIIMGVFGLAPMMLLEKAYSSNTFFF